MVSHVGRHLNVAAHMLAKHAKITMYSVWIGDNVVAIQAHINLDRPNM